MTDETFAPRQFATDLERQLFHKNGEIADKLYIGKCLWAVYRLAHNETHSDTPPEVTNGLEIIKDLIWENFEETYQLTEDRNK